MPAFILEKLCRGCNRCLKACPVQAITTLAHLLIVDPTKCMECEACMEVCMHGSITFIAIEVKKADG